MIRSRENKVLSHCLFSGNTERFTLSFIYLFCFLLIRKNILRPTDRNTYIKDFFTLSCSLFEVGGFVGVLFMLRVQHLL